MRRTSLIRALGLIALVATGLGSMADAHARGFGGGFHGGGFHGGGFHGGGYHWGGYHGGGFGGYRSARYGASRSGRVGTRFGHSFLLENQSNPVFATGF